jgi:hypothetical protein
LGGVWDRTYEHPIDSRHAEHQKCKLVLSQMTEETPSKKMMEMLWGKDKKMCPE